MSETLPSGSLHVRLWLRTGHRAARVAEDFERGCEKTMSVYIISDTHLKHDKMKTYCERPEDFTERIHRNIMTTVKPDDMLIHVGDVGIGATEAWEHMVREWPGHKTLVIGNHDHHGPEWWLKHGFDSACTAMVFRGVWITHRPANALPEGCTLNLHGHLHNIWHGFHPEAVWGSAEDVAFREKRLMNPWQRLFAVEYTNYMPVEWTKFFAHPFKYQATGPNSLDKPVGPVVSSLNDWSRSDDLM